MERKPGFELVLSSGPHLVGTPAGALLCIVTETTTNHLLRIVNYLSIHMPKNPWLGVFRSTLMLWQARNELNSTVDALMRTRPDDNYGAMRLVNPPLATDDALQLALWIEEMNVQLTQCVDSVDDGLGK